MISRLAAAVVFVVSAGNAVAQQNAAEIAALEPGAVFRECPSCPLMTVVPAASGADGTFAIAVDPISLGEWAVCSASGAYCQSNAAPGDASWVRGARPVVFVSWDDATGPMGYVDWVNAQVADAPYRLPTAAELAYAAGAASAMRAGSGGDMAAVRARVDGDNAVPGVWRQGPLIIGGAANPTGRHNLRGDLWEWTQECSSQVADRECPRTVLRTAADRDADAAHSRLGYPSDARSGGIGFRLVRRVGD